MRTHPPEPPVQARPRLVAHAEIGLTHFAGQRTPDPVCGRKTGNAVTPHRRLGLHTTSALVSFDPDLRAATTKVVRRRVGRLGVLYAPSKPRLNRPRRDQ